MGRLNEGREMENVQMWRRF